MNGPLPVFPDAAGQVFDIPSNSASIHYLTDDFITRNTTAHELGHILGRQHANYCKARSEVGIGITFPKANEKNNRKLSPFFLLYTSLFFFGFRIADENSGDVHYLDLEEGRKAGGNRSPRLGHDTCPIQRGRLSRH